jgi:AraC family transcriptional regulator
VRLSAGTACGFAAIVDPDSHSGTSTALDVPIPGTQDYLVVAYQDGATAMNRLCTGDWRREQVAPGSISLLTRAAQSHWRWSDDIEVTHLYLSVLAVADVAAQAYERNVRDIELRDVLRTEAPSSPRSSALSDANRAMASWAAGSTWTL